MAGEDARVRVVEDRRLDAPAEQLLRLAHEVLVERVLGRDEHREAVAAPPGAAPLLAQRGDRSREADRDHRVEQADVDPELERVGRRDAEQVALGEAPLDLAPLLDGVAGAVGREPRVVAEPLGREAVDQLGRLAALREGERAQAALDEAGLELRRLRERRSAQPELDVEERRVPEDDGALGARRRVVADHRHRRPEQRLAELARVRDRRRGEQELRLGAVDRGRSGAGAAARWRRASRRRRGRRAPRRRRRSGGSRAPRPSARGSGAGRCGPCPGWSGSRSTTCGSASAARSACRRRRSPAAASGRGARSACGTGPARAPSSGTGRAHGASASARGRRGSAG